MANTKSVIELVAEVSAELVVGEVTIYSIGMVCCSVCAPAGMDRELIERQVNKATPTGINSAWRVSDEDFNTGQSNPTQCDQDSTRLHYLLSC